MVKLATTFIFLGVMLFILYFFREIRFIRLVIDFFESPNAPFLLKASGFFGIVGILILIMRGLWDVFGKKDKYSGVEK